MTLSITTDSAPVDAAGSYVVDETADDEPVLYYRTARGAEQNAYRRLQAQLEDARTEYLDNAPEPADEAVDAIRGNSDIDTDDPERAAKLAGFVPPEEVHREYLRLARDLTVGVEGVEVDSEPIEWSDDSCFAGFGADPRCAFLDAVASAASSNAGALYDYVATAILDPALDGEERENLSST